MYKRQLSKYLPGNRTFYSRTYIAKRLNGVFEEVDTPVVEGMPPNCACCFGENFTAFTDHYTNFVVFHDVYTHTNVTKNVVLSRYSMLIEHVVKQIDQLRRHLVYRKEYLDHARDTIRRVGDVFASEDNIPKETLTYVGVHVRRTDYLSFLKTYELPEVSVGFYKLCIEYFRARKDLGRSVFLIVSDDPQWVDDNLISEEHDDLYLVSRGNVKTCLLYTSKCYLSLQSVVLSSQ